MTEDISAREFYHRFLAEHLNADELAAVFRIVDALEPADILAAAEDSGQRACLALAAMLREMAMVAPSDAAFMVGYDPMLLRQEVIEAKKTPEQKELEWWQGLMGFLFVGTFGARWPDQMQAIQFRNALIDYLVSFPRILRPRVAFWRRVSERRNASSTGFQPPR